MKEKENGNEKNNKIEIDKININQMKEKNTKDKKIRN